MAILQRELAFGGHEVESTTMHRNLPGGPCGRKAATQHKVWGCFQIKHTLWLQGIGSGWQRNIRGVPGGSIGLPCYQWNQLLPAQVPGMCWASCRNSASQKYFNQIVDARTLLICILCICQHREA